MKDGNHRRNRRGGYRPPAARRRWVYRFVIPLLAVISLVYGGRAILRRSGDSDTPTTGKNLVLILFDSLRKDHMPLYGYDRNTTPSLLELSEDAVVFDQCIAQAPWTKPSIASLFTATYPTNHTVVEENARWKLPSCLMTLAEVLSENGYYTAAVMENGHMGLEGFDQGFQDYHVHADKGGEIIADTAIDVLDTRPEDAPFFLMVFFLNPHYPYRPKKEPPFDKDPGELDYEWKYDGEIFEADEQVGRIVGALRDHDLMGRTVIVFAADHGEDMYQHGERHHGRTLYDSTINVPLFITGLGRQGRMRGLIREIDLMPTLLDYLGAEISGECKRQMAGVSAREFIERNAERTGLVAYSETRYRGSELRAKRTEERKLIADLKNNTVEMYDMVNDPEEKSDMAADSREYNDKARAEHRALAAWADSQWRVDKEARTLPVPPGFLERLKAMGYVGND